MPPRCLVAVLVLRSRGEGGCERSSVGPQGVAQFWLFVASLSGELELGACQAEVWVKVGQDRRLARVDVVGRRRSCSAVPHSVSSAGGVTHHVYAWQELLRFTERQLCRVLWCFRQAWSQSAWLRLQRFAVGVCEGRTHTPYSGREIWREGHAVQ